MKLRYVCLLVAIATAAHAQRKMTVNEVVSFVKSSVKQKQDDRLVADYLQRKIKLTEKLEDRAVEDLQGQGAGPKTVSALRKLSIESAGLSAAAPPQVPKPPPPPIPPPSSIEQKAILAEIRENALNYTNGLPNFICSQVTHRNADPTGTGEHWREIDRIQEQLTFFDHHEKYTVTMINGKMATAVDHDRMGGVRSSGEFGSMLREIFDPQTETQFEWEKWATWDGHRMYVFSFRVAQSHSQYDIYHDASQRRIVAGYHGLIYADRDTKSVIRIKMECVGIPIDFPVQQVALTLEYKTQKISDQEFLLPLKFDLSSREGSYLVKNETEFRLYHKYGAEEKITFDTDTEPAKPDPKPPVKKQ